MLVDKLKFVHGYRLRTADFAYDMRCREFLGVAMIVPKREKCLPDLQSVDPLDESRPIRSPSKLAVSDRLEADALL
jgi:hypothetical protein